jgi:NADH-quinone oxidoreductase subunit N
MLAGLAAGNVKGESGILFYLAAYTVMNIGAFGIVSFVEGRYGTKLTFDDYAGLSVRRPYLAALMSVFMFSLAGIPPFAGFVGKYYVFLAAVEADLVWLAVIGVLTSLVSVYYYLRLVVVMYFREGQADVEAEPSLPAMVSVTVAAFFVLQIGVLPSLIVNFAQRLL